MRVQKLLRRMDGGSAGMTLVECIIAICVLGMLGLQVTKSMVTMYQVNARSAYNNYAAQLAMQKMEEWSSKNPTTYGAAQSATETGVYLDFIRYQRVSTIVVNADSSRTVSVAVTAVRSGYSGTATYTNTFALWGKS